jgi:hypothetical protein
MFVAAVGVNEREEAKSFLSMVITTQKSMEDLIAGKIEEHQVEPYPKGGRETGYLFWLALVLEDRQHTPYLIKSAFTDLEKVMKDWKVNISHVVAIAYTKLSHRILKNHHFKQVGIYQGQYPIMAIDVIDNVWLKAFIPYIKVDSTPPWPGKVEKPVPEIDRSKKTEFDR